MWWVFGSIILFLWLLYYTPWIQNIEKEQKQQRINTARQQAEWQKQDSEQRKQYLREADAKRFNERNQSQSVRAELASDRSVAWRVYIRDKYRCVRCGADGTDPRNDLTIEHKIPVSRGGTNVLANLETLCRSCNSRKGARI